MKVNLGAQRRARIEILPLIDIVFLLLVFFIYAMLSMAVHRGVPVKLPASSSAEIERKLTVAVTIKDSGDIMLDTDRVALQDLAPRLRTKAEGLGVLLFADREVSCQLLVKVLDQIRIAGVTRVSLQTTKEAIKP
ncbi:MAG: biopolymer transporter ExbD [Deltaproteobacteria bacterium]|nr:biopolymer transporter ExbD [Deltaproteobacteria bacterium]MBW2076724.1 biopolymer transporter ExbD [Deltaproteobacteria bacterium]MBW2309589.1 biopolymer transporter ExbD [Deltaproteobacteria bacterium]RLB28841.1 MAG: biopolymer transporter ExbD [Deltaproteobacteria bacterium]